MFYLPIFIEDEVRQVVLGAVFLCAEVRPKVRQRSIIESSNPRSALLCFKVSQHHTRCHGFTKVGNV